MVRVVNRGLEPACSEILVHGRCQNLVLIRLPTSCCKVLRVVSLSALRIPSLRLHHVLVGLQGFKQERFLVT